MFFGEFTLFVPSPGFLTVKHGEFLSDGDDDVYDDNNVKDYNADHNKYNHYKSYRNKGNQNKDLFIKKK